MSTHTEGGDRRTHDGGDGCMHGQKAQTDACAHTTMVEACWACGDAEGGDGRTHDGGDGCTHGDGGGVCTHDVMVECKRDGIEG